MEYADKDLTCIDCGTQFLFTAGEQEFYASRGLQNEPRRCRNCRQERKQGGQSAPREMHNAVCAQCGNETQVPFKPTGVRPVYCGECFASMRS